METPNKELKEMGNGARQVANQASRKATQASASAVEGLEGFREEIEERFHDVEKRAKQWADASYDVVKTYPVYSILGAAAIGFLAASILGRNRN